MEYGVPYFLDTPAGTVNLNDFAATPHFRLTDAVLTKAARSDELDRPQRHGGIFPTKLRRAAHWSLPGQLVDGGDFAVRAGRMQYLRACLYSILNVPGTLRWTPSDGVAKQMQVTAADGDPQWQGDIPKAFLLSLVAEDPTSYGQALRAASTSPLTVEGGSWSFPFSFPFTLGAPSGGGTMTVTNAGDADSWPVVTIRGAVTGPSLRNLTTGLQLSLPGLVLAAGDTAVVDCFRETVRLNGSATAPLDEFLDQATSTFWTLAPGANTLQLTGGAFDATAGADVSYRDGYA